MKETIVIVGGIPEPIGGVTVFTFRLANALSDSMNIRVLDLYPEQNKITSRTGVSHLISPQARSRRLIWLARQIFGQRLVHFNFSQPRALLIFALLPKWKTRWILTLHHGNLKKHHSTLIGFLWKLIGWRLDHIVALTESQYDYFISNGIKQETITVGGSYVRPTKQLEDRIDSNTLTLIKKLKQQHRKIVFASGYKTSIYRHLDLIREFQRVDSATDCGILICIYGPDSESMETQIRSYAAQYSNVTIINSVDQTTYNYILKEVDIYVRPNKIDSCGIAVHDAHYYGTTIIASDVCIRPTSACIYPVDDWNLLRRQLHRHLSNNEVVRETALQPQISVADSLEYYRALYQALANYPPH